MLFHRAKNILVIATKFQTAANLVKKVKSIIKTLPEWMQMAKINARLTLLSDVGLPYISILSDPTTAGVSASYALMGDINIAEPNALIGFTGERITGSSVEEEELAALRRAQRAEQVLENGFVDLVVPRKNLRATLDRLFGLLLDTRMTGS